MSSGTAKDSGSRKAPERKAKSATAKTGGATKSAHSASKTSDATVTVGLSINDAFAEISAPGHFQRWFLARKSLGEGVREFLKPFTSGGTLRIVTSNVESDLSRHTGTTLAFMVTGGFERWLNLAQPTLAASQLTHPKRGWSPLHEDRIFGITERLRPDGQVEQALAIDEIEFLISKLQLLQINNVAIGFLHSNQNPDHEMAAAAYLRERGFNVVCSHQMSSENELTRWWLAILESYVQAPVHEQINSLAESLAKEAEGAPWEIEIWSRTGLSPWEQVKHKTLETLWGRQKALQEAFPQGPTLHLGLDRFYLVLPGEKETWQSEFGLWQLPTPRCLELSVQPLARIATGFWPVPEILKDSVGFEPGPMFFGRAQNLSVLDILFVRDHLPLPEGLQALANEKSRPRILETIFTLAKALPQLNVADAQCVAEDLEQLIIEKVIQELDRHGVREGVRLSGALAPALRKPLQNRQPHWNWQIIDETDQSDAIAAAGGQRT